jgi:EAL domain-containing protein (putative c-di-GMP-specific phosphodiesterase class I)
LSIDPIRILGLAFAAADMLFEIDERGAVSLAVGASQRLCGRAEASLVGASWLELIAETDREFARALVCGAADGERRGPAVVRMAAAEARYASLTVFRLPGNAARCSCALTQADPPAAGRARDGALFRRETFEAASTALVEAARGHGGDLELGLIELGGLGKHQAGLADAEAEALRRQVAGALRAEAVDDLAADLGADRFAVLRRRGGSPQDMARRLGRVLGAVVTPSVQTFAVDAFGDSGRMLRALRFALDSFVSDDASMSEASSLSEVLDLSVRETIAKADAFQALVKARRFELMFQPVVDLTDGEAHHYEVLVRFDGKRSPFAMIRMAEELDIIESLDRAVADESIKRLRADKGGKLRLAVNVSGRTITSPGFLKMIERECAMGDLSGRLMLELTESATIDDLALAQRHVQALQKRGIEICLDDFGAGAASYGYLQQLSVDVVKIDGAYVRALTGSGRDDAMIRHLVRLCRELKVATVAEMVETQEVADALRAAGVDYGQGWLFGQPEPEPKGLEAPSPPVVARRKGAVEQWG